uniref:Uncharacterized protein n=1 Tax=Trypanosoma congolense (strain IL3000) TaxID=1068625 RepID=G0V036_TRYCI|nr:conserved hypothetical protein [Trypanosoma congolense IL3000]
MEPMPLQHRPGKKTAQHTPQKATGGGPTSNTATTVNVAAAGASQGSDVQTAERKSVGNEGVNLSPKPKVHDAVTVKNTANSRASAPRQSISAASGAHIRRRPPSVPERAASPKFGSAAASTLWREMVEQRADPSPAPRRTLKRRSITTTAPLHRLPSAAPRGRGERTRAKGIGQSFEDLGRTNSLRHITQDVRRGPLLSLHSANSSVSGQHQRFSSPVKGSLGTARPPIVLDAKQSAQSRMMRMKLCGLSPNNNEEARKEVVSCYMKLCEEVGHAPQESLVAAVLAENSDAVSDSNTCKNVACRPAAADGSSSRSANRSVRRLMSNSSIYVKSHSVGDNLQRSRSMPKYNSYSNVKPPVPAATRYSTGAPGVSLSRDESLRQMIAQCDHLRLYSKKIGQLKQRRHELKESLSCFLDMCSKEQDATHERETQEQCEEPDLNNSRISAITALESRANSLTCGLKDLQRCSVALLLCLSELSCEIRRPLGSVGSDTLNPSGEQQQHQVVKGHGVSPIPRIQNIPKVVGSLPAPLSGALGGTPIGYLNFLRSEERAIVQQLSDMCTEVRAALAQGSGITTADEGLLETPLFIPSTWSGPACVSTVPKDAKLYEQTNQLKAGSSVNVARRALYSSSAPASRVLSRFSSITKNFEGNSSMSKCGDSQRSVGPGGNTMPTSDVHLPFVGVAFAEMDKTSDEEKESAFRSDNNENHDQHLRSPRLIIGGGSRRLSLDTVTEKLTRSSFSANAVPANKLCRAKSTVPVGGNRKKLVVKSTTDSSPSSAFKRLRARAGKKVLPRINEDSVTAAQIMQAKTIWATIQGLVGLTSASSIAGGSSPSNAADSCVEKNGAISADCSTHGSQWVEQVVKSVEDIIGVGTRSGRLGDSSTSEAKAIRQTDGESAANQHPSPSSVGGGMREDDAARIVTRFMRRAAKRRVFVNNEAGEKEEGHSVQKDAEPTALEVVSRASVDKYASYNTKLCHESAVLIATCWRRYRNRKEIGQRRNQLREEQKRQQENQYRTVMAARLQSFFVISIAVRRRRRLIQRTQESEQKVAVASSAPDKTTTLPSIRQKTNIRENGNSPVSTMREKFDRTREKRKSLRDHHDKMEGSSTRSGNSVKAGPCTPTKGSKGKTQQTTASTKKQVAAKAVCVPRLLLKSSGLSTFYVENYHPEAVNLKVGMLHRLLRAPKALVYALRVMCSGYESRPESAYDVLSRCGWKSTKERGDYCTPEHTGGDGEKESTMEDTAGKFSSASKSGSVAREDNDDSKCSGEEENVEMEIKKFSVACYPHLRRGEGAADGSAAICDQPPGILSKHPLSIRVDSFIDSNELRFPEPVQKSLPRPFEHWSIVHSLQQRIFTAGALYAWKLIFSHTPHDDYKQRMLSTREEQEARLERVEQRNRMILACYCVRSEAEWLREASADLNFVGRIWNPKRSLDPNDPDFERHCRETYEFVENFLYQCFPTLSVLEDAPTFLIGAGIYFVLQATLSKLGALEGAEDAVEVDSLSRNSSRLNAQQRQALFVYELLSLIDALSIWHSPQKAKSNDALKKAKPTGKQPTPTEASDDSFISWRARLESTIKSMGSSSPAQMSSSVTLESLTDVNGVAADVTERMRPRLVMGSTSPHDSKGENKKNEDCFSLVYPSGFFIALSERLARCLVGLKLDLDVCEDLAVTA